MKIVKFLYAVAAFLSFASVECFAEDPVEKLQIDSFQKAREIVAQSIEKRSGPLVPTQISLRPVKRQQQTASPESSGWLAKFSKNSLIQTQAMQEIEVVARTKSGDLVIDRFSIEDLSLVETIVDDAGLVVGYFNYWTTKEPGNTSARGAFKMYFLGDRSLIAREGDLRCQKSENKAKPTISFKNSQWDNETRELVFDVRANCSVLNFFGSSAREYLNLTVLDFKSALDNNDSSWVEEQN
jgi:hypothetical protein